MGQNRPGVGEQRVAIFSFGSEIGYLIFLDIFCLSLCTLILQIKEDNVKKKGFKDSLDKIKIWPKKP